MEDNENSESQRDSHMEPVVTKVFEADKEDDYNEFDDDYNIDDYDNLDFDENWN